jgi:hypothetical protein
VASGKTIVLSRHLAPGIENTLKKPLARVVVPAICRIKTNYWTTKFGHHLVNHEVIFQQYKDKNNFKNIIPHSVHYF